MFTYKLLRTINNEVSIIQINNNKFIYKRTKNRKSASSFFEYITLLFKLSFKTELAVNEAILATPFKSKVPKLLFTDYKSFLVFEYLEATDGLPTNKELNLINQTLIEGYLQFHRDLDFKIIRFSKFHSIYSVNLSYFRSSIYYLKNYSIYIKLVLIFIGSNLKQKKIGRFLIHKDLKNYQNIMHDNENIYFIDFANVNLENKWIMIDIVDLAFNLDTHNLDESLILLYLEKLNNPNINSNVQIRFILIRKFLYLIGYYRNIKKSHCRELDFLSKVLLDELGYKTWLNENNI